MTVVCGLVGKQAKLQVSEVSVCVATITNTSTTEDYQTVEDTQRKHCMQDTLTTVRHAFLRDFVFFVFGQKWVNK